MLQSAKVCKITISMLNNFFTIGFRAINSMASVYKEPRYLEMYPYLIFDLYFKVTMPILDLK
jgi:hypothetical protein